MASDTQPTILRLSRDSEMEKGLNSKMPTVSVEAREAAEATEDERETRPANHIHWGSAIVDILIAILPLYFVVFCILAYVRNNTLASSFRNTAILQMANFNPTIFPILFTLIFAKFIKAIANWKLERGATVGQIQHLLGSRSLVNSIFTPMKLRTLSLLVPLLVMVWALNPLGGQLSLRAVSRQLNTTTIDTEYLYMSPNNSVDLRALSESAMPEAYTRAINMGFNTALITPDTSKNGTQDVFGNVHIPMLEYLQLNQTADTDGWFHTADINMTGIEAAIAHAKETHVWQKPIHVSLLGLPFKANLTSINAADATDSPTVESYDEKLVQIRRDLFGDEVVNTRLNFTVQSSYIYASCKFEPMELGPRITYDNYTAVNKPRFPDGTIGVVSDNQGFTIAYDGQHNYNSTSPRRIGIKSWKSITEPGQGTMHGSASTVWCDLTTTYVEAVVYCAKQNDCAVTKARQSRDARNYSSALTALDGITYPFLNGEEGYSQQFQNYANLSASIFFSNFINSTGNDTVGVGFLNPLASFFAAPDSPYKASQGASLGSSVEQAPLTDLGDAFFSRRLTQLLNTYWQISIDPFTATSGIDMDLLEDSSSVAVPLSSAGKTYIDKTVLRCHMPYMIVLLLISIGLFGLGLATAYLDATRKGPDVLDDFVNSLRHNPYVRTDKLGPSMEDGQDMARRLRNTVVQMGDVRPDDSVGYVAIGTPNNGQAVQRLDHRRHYL